MRGEQTIEDFVRSFTSVGNLNSFPVDRPLYVFLRPGLMPKDEIARDAELAHVMIVAVSTQCYLVDDLERSCAYVADTPGGEPEAVLGRGDLVPEGLSVETIEAAASVTEVVESGYFRATAAVDLERWTTIPEIVGEG